MTPIRLRPHHLLCLLTYAGHGYTRAFTHGFDRIARDLKRGRRVVLASGPDEICAGLEGAPARRHCLSRDVARRDRRALVDLSRAGFKWSSGVVLTPHLVHRLRRAFVSGDVRGACLGCSWKPLCDRLAVANFAGCRVFGARKSPRSA